MKYVLLSTLALLALSISHAARADAAKYMKAAEKGDAGAQYNLGVCYATGNGVKKNAARAVEWYTKAARQGNADAQNNLGQCYITGVGVDKDPAKAVEWFIKSAEQGNAVAQNNLGLCYARGNGVDKDQDKAGGHVLGSIILGVLLIIFAVASITLMPLLTGGEVLWKAE